MWSQFLQIPASHLEVEAVPPGVPRPRKLVRETWTNNGYDHPKLVVDLKYDGALRVGDTENESLHNHA
jgi:hypothetical protein